MADNIKFKMLADSIKNINIKAGNAANSAVNQLMTLRNWAIGYYIVEYEQGGSDRAEYGANLLKTLEKQIDEKGMNSTLFRWCRQFYNLYPQIGATVSHKFNLPNFGKCATVSHIFMTKPDVLVNNLSFSHIREIMVIDDAFERLIQQSKDNRNITSLTIKDPFTFEFLGLDAKETVSETDLEQALMNHLQEFMLELGEGFCFEARQKRIVIDDKYYFIESTVCINVYVTFA